jgi:murein DD-endopeptidase MepM/ murein hydrolase activator NlpD/putative intracellular protease/amidase
MSTAFNTVWRPGSGMQWVHWGMTGDDFKAQDAIYLSQGLRVTSFVVKDDRIAAVWHPGTGVQWIHWGMSDGDFKAQDAIYFAQGLRVTSLTIEGGRFGAVWHPGNGTQWIRWGMTGDEFKAQDTTYVDQGLRVTSLVIKDGKIAAVWQPGSGIQWIRWGMSDDELAAQDQTYFAQGLRLKTLTNDDGRYAAVWHPGSGTQWCSWRRGEVDFKAEDAAYLQAGLRIASFDLQEGPVGAYRYPWKGGDSYTVGQGNNNATGSHNGSQSFAYDFSLPSGTEIRAAREGTVEWLQENLTATYDPTEPTSATNMPFPNGSLQNWGNTVRIRHSGGFSSWYFHIQANGVRVNVGDVVTQGQVIATSGNTGRTSGPHLHFQVQADSIDWGQSVPCTFGDDCEQPATNDTATSDNAT